jgi:hypothetical protein
MSGIKPPHAVLPILKKIQNKVLKEDLELL